MKRQPTGIQPGLVKKRRDDAETPRSSAQSGWFSRRSESTLYRGTNQKYAMLEALSDMIMMYEVAPELGKLILVVYGKLSGLLQSLEVMRSQMERLAEVPRKLEAVLRTNSATSKSVAAVLDQLSRTALQETDRMDL